jgi:hypothetical protein
VAGDAEVTDLALQAKAKLGPDWVCEYCSTSNAGDKATCGSCGTIKGESVPRQEVKEYGLGEAPTTGDMTLEYDEQEEAPAEPPKKKGPSPLLIGGIVAVFALLCIIAAFLIFGGKNADANVSGFQWDRAVEIEELQTVNEEDWSLPSGGRLISQREEIHHYDQVLDHYEDREHQISFQEQVGERTYVCGQRDLGNGFFEDINCTEPVYETKYRTESYQEPIYNDVPVYQTKYFYEIDKWIVIRTETAAAKDHSPFWPRSDLSGDQREGDQSETYVIYFKDGDGKLFEFELTLDEWLGYESGQNVILKLNALGNISEIER